MAKSKKQLYLTIEQAGKVLHHRLSKRERFTIGLHPENDLTVYGKHLPKKHVLFLRKNNHFQLKLKKFMDGEAIAGQSRVSFQDMIMHDLLSNKGDSFFYPITPDKKGFIVVGDAKISFQFVTRKLSERSAATLPKFRGYSWTYATLKGFGRDLLFKAILVVIIVIHAFILNYMSKLPTTIKPKSITLKVPERFARIILKSPPINVPVKKTVGIRAVSEDGSTEGSVKRNRAEKGYKEVRPESQGVLGLLTGTGSSNQSNSLADFLLDKGLVKELNEVMSNSQLQLGQGTKEGELDLDNLIAISELGGGIDDIVEDVDQVESIALGEKGQIQVDQVGTMTGTQEALGQRSEESVRAVMLSYTGRLTYIYNKYLKRNPTLQGKLVVEVVIAATGSVHSVKKVSSTMNNPEFDREILNFIRRWKYEAIDTGTVTVTYPLFFNKVG